mgnify:FL=1
MEENKFKEEQSSSMENVDSKSQGNSVEKDDTKSPNTSDPKSTLKNTSDLLNTVKSQFVSNKKIVGIVGVFIVAVIAFILFSSRPTKLSKYFDVTFNGYDGHGMLNYNHEVVIEEISQAAIKKAGFSKDEIDAFESGNSQMVDTKKMAKYTAIMNNLKFNFDKVSDLKNGDKVTLTVSCKGNNCPFVNETKEYTVNGLDEMQEITLEDLEKEYPITFTGYNGFGSVKFDSTVYTISTAANQTLKNDDTIKVKITEGTLNTLANDGKKLKDEATSFEKKVTGLPEITDIVGLNDILNKTDILMQSKTKPEDGWFDKTTYVTEKQQDYILFNASDSKDSEGKLSLLTIYKITKTVTPDSDSSRTAETTTYFTYFGYIKLTVSEGKIIQKDMSYHEETTSTEWENFDSIDADLKKDGYAPVSIAQ